MSMDSERGKGAAAGNTHRRFGKTCTRNNIKLSPQYPPMTWAHVKNERLMMDRRERAVSIATRYIASSVNGSSHFEFQIDTMSHYFINEVMFQLTKWRMIFQ